MRAADSRSPRRTGGHGEGRRLRTLLAGLLLGWAGMAWPGTAAAQELQQAEVQITVKVQEYLRFVDLRPTQAPLTFSEAEVLAGEQLEDRVVVTKPEALVFSYDANNTIPIAIHISTPQGLIDPSTGAEIPSERLEWRLRGEQTWQALGAQGRQVALLRPGSIVALDLRLNVLRTDPVGSYGTVIVFTIMAVPEEQGQG